ncbi:NAD(P)H-binding protein [Dongia soli]|uniref:NAD(P)H-binding protein n=1 Tax=Dongia soli TaxID=600628 RepID=A0ABU5ED20_9PROT|nr:NAD(P)H-binding protein [Dongia soli]MDY0884081.1 NAD(P)H-binding protein [Dongia soli]
MRILVLGGGGFIGRHLVAELIGNGHQVVATARHERRLRGAIAGMSVLELDLAKAIQPDDWAPLLAGIDVIVNAAGILRGRDMQRLHVDMPRALYTAAEAAGVKRVILISAISARPDVETDYAKTKLAGEELLRRSGLNWTILRPSLVYGDGSYGGTSLLRGMAGLPWLMPVPGAGDFAFTPIHLSDLAHTVRRICEEDDFAGRVLEPVGPETLTLRRLLMRYRAWLGLGPAYFVKVPMPLMRLLGRIGDWLGDGPIATNSLAQMIAGNAGDSVAFAQAIGFEPRSLDAVLTARPAQVQDRWHARLFFLVPAITAVLALLWVASAILGLTTGAAKTTELVSALGWPMALAEPLRIGSSLLDLCLAIFVLIDRSARRSTLAQLIVVLGYSLLIGFALPALWLDPLGPLLKNLPILILILVHGAIGDKR